MLGAETDNKSFAVYVFAVLGAETDVVRVFDENLKISEHEMKEYLKKANLEKYGFQRSEEKSIETDENGRKMVKKTIYYMVTDDCSRVMFWESVLEQRLPDKLRKSHIFSKTVKEVKNRIQGRKTKGCRVGLEIHVKTNQCLLKKTADENAEEIKRGLRKGCCNWFNCCDGCSQATITYAD